MSFLYDVKTSFIREMKPLISGWVWLAFGLVAQLLFTADFRTISPSYAGANFAVLGITVPVARLAAFAVAWVLAAVT